MGKPKLVDAAPAAVPRKHGPGGPWVTVRAHYGALPSLAGRDRRRVGESLPGWRACSRLRPEERSQGRRSRRWRDAGRRFRGLCFPAIRETSRGSTTKVRLSAFRLPSLLGRGEKDKSPPRAPRAGARALGCLNLEIGKCNKTRNTRR